VAVAVVSRSLFPSNRASATAVDDPTGLLRRLIGISLGRIIFRATAVLSDRPNAGRDASIEDPTKDAEVASQLFRPERVSDDGVDGTLGEAAERIRAPV